MNGNATDKESNIGTEFHELPILEFEISKIALIPAKKYKETTTRYETIMIKQFLSSSLFETRNKNGITKRGR